MSIIKGSSSGGSSGWVSSLTLGIGAAAAAVGIYLFLRHAQSGLGRSSQIDNKKEDRPSLKRLPFDPDLKPKGKDPVTAIANKQFLTPPSETPPILPTPPILADSSGFQKVCESPVIMHCKQWLSDSECKECITSATSKLQASTTATISGKSIGTVSGGRVSKTAYFRDGEIRQSPILQKVVAISKQLTESFGYKVDKVEIQMSWYTEGGKFGPHYDPLEIGTGERVTTLLLYLNTPQEGGQTVFYKPQNGNTGNVIKKDERGRNRVCGALPGEKIYEVHPEQGSVILFRNFDDKGQLDFNSLHAGLPVIKGEKWILTAWAYGKPQLERKEQLADAVCAIASPTSNLSRTSSVLESISKTTTTPRKGLVSRGLKIIQIDGSYQLVRRDPADQEIQHLTFPQGRLIIDSYRKTLLQLKNNIIDILSYGEKGTALVDTILPAFRDSYFFAQKQVDAFVDEMIHEHGKDTAIVSLQQQHEKVLAILKNEGTTYIENDRRMKACYDYIELVIREMERDNNSMEDGAKERVRPSGIYGLFLELFLLGKLSIPPIALSGVPGDEPGERLGDYNNHTESGITTPVVVMPSLSFFDQDGNIQSPVVVEGLALVPPLSKLRQASRT